jgi:hypothetical protein
MKRSSTAAAAALALLMTSALAASQSAAPEPPIQSMPEVTVIGEPERRHPQDGGYSEPELGCEEIVTPSTGGQEVGSAFQASFAEAGIPVMPDLNDPSSSSEIHQPDGKMPQAIPPGWTSSTPPCR